MPDAEMVDVDRACRCAIAAPARAKDGYDLWLRYRPLPTEQTGTVAMQPTGIVRDERDPTFDLAAAKLARGLSGLTGRAVADGNVTDGAIVIGTAKSARIAGLGLPLQSLGREGFVLRSVAIKGKRTTVVAANRSIGVLYGASRLLRIAQMTGSLTDVSVTDRPKLGMRLLNHWDNVERR